MERFVRITKENFPNIYEKKIDKYALVNDSQQILGIASINNNSSINKIDINVYEKYRGNGYGKVLFGEALKQYKNKYNNDDLRFEVDDQSLFNSILQKFGGVNVSNNKGNLMYILRVV